MSYLVDRHTQVLFRTAAAVRQGGIKRAIVAEPRAHYVVIALAGIKKRLPVSWDRIHRLDQESQNSKPSDHEIHHGAHLILRTASCIYEAGRLKPIMVELRPLAVVIGVAGNSGHRRPVSWEQIYRLARKLDAENTRFEAAALKAQINHEPQNPLRLRRRK